MTNNYYKRRTLSWTVSALKNKIIRLTKIEKHERKNKILLYLLNN